MLKSIDRMKLLYTIAAATGLPQIPNLSTAIRTIQWQHVSVFPVSQEMLRKGVADYLGPVTCSEEDHKDDQTFPSWMKCVLSFKIRARSLP